MSNGNIQRMLDYVDSQYPQFTQGIKESIANAPEQFDSIANQYLTWALIARGENAIEKSIDAYVQFTMDVNFAQARYEASGHYENKSFEEVYKNHYSQRSEMDDYLWGVYLTNFLWAHHLEICLFFENRFLSRLSSQPSIIEIAPGHGGWGVWALHKLTDARLEGYDISPSSIDIASSVAKAAGVDARTSYQERDALDLKSLDENIADAVICSFLLEHLEEPTKLFAVVNQVLKPGAVAFITGALTAAQVDHIYEIHHESEMMAMAESQGLRVLETLSTNPKRLFPKAKFVPRSMAMLVQKPRLVK